MTVSVNCFGVRAVAQNSLAPHLLLIILCNWLCTLRSRTKPFSSKSFHLTIDSFPKWHKSRITEDVQICCSQQSSDQYLP